jgi:hypothetical protein
MPRRPTNAKVIDADAECRDCDWTSDGAGALGRAAQHHDRTDHYVYTRQTIVVEYGVAQTPEERGQTVLDDVGEPGTVAE